MNETPVNLRIAADNSPRQCSNCVNFRTIQRAWPHDDGHCSGYEHFVRGDFVCDSFSPVPGCVVPDLGPSDDHKPDQSRFHSMDFLTDRQ